MTLHGKFVGRGNGSGVMNKQKWRTIGEVCVDSGHLIISDPCRAEEASNRWIDNDLDLNECAKNGIREWELTNDHHCPVGPLPLPVSVVVSLPSGLASLVVVSAFYSGSVVGAERAA